MFSDELSLNYNLTAHPSCSWPLSPITRHAVNTSSGCYSASPGVAMCDIVWADLASAHSHESKTLSSLALPAWLCQNLQTQQQSLCSFCCQCKRKPCQDTGLRPTPPLLVAVTTQYTDLSLRYKVNLMTGPHSSTAAQQSAKLVKEPWYKFLLLSSELWPTTKPLYKAFYRSSWKPLKNISVHPNIEIFIPFYLKLVQKT